MNSAADFAKMLPGMDFLQGLVRNAGAALPGLGQWVTPTLDPEELDKRIQDLRTVQFWLEQNARLLATTIQALEVQRMTLSTLKTMNLPMADLAQALQARSVSAADPGVGAAASMFSAARPAPPPPPSAPPPPPVAPPPAEPPAAAAPAEAASPPPPPLVDPMQWWGALTQQFGEIAARALKDGATLPGAGGDAAGGAARKSTQAKRAAPKAAAKAAGKTAAKAATKTATKTATQTATKRQAKPRAQPAAKQSAPAAAPRRR
jgi:hypothetical protein